MHFPCSITSYLIKYVKKRTLKILHLNGISANFCCFIIGDLSPLLPEPVTYYLFIYDVPNMSFVTLKYSSVGNYFWRKMQSKFGKCASLAMHTYSKTTRTRM